MFKRLAFLFVVMWSGLSAQDNFEWKSNKERISIPFKLVSNLIILPVEINDVELNMILDTGSESSMIFTLPENDTLEFRNLKKVFLRGIGESEKIEALYSDKNKLDIAGYTHQSFPLLLVLNQEVNISERLGVEVNGILNGSFFKNRIVEINYESKQLIIHKEAKILQKKKYKKYERVPIKVFDNRPYITVDAAFGETKVSLNLLVDIGLSDGLWLFENDSIQSNATYFEDILGRGLSGEVVGKRSRVDNVRIKNFEFEQALVSYPYQKYLPLLNYSERRNGSIGAGLMHRFHVVFDFQHNEILLKPNSKFSNPFHYNMSGLQIQHNGTDFFKETVSLTPAEGARIEKRVDHFVNGSENFLYKFVLKPVYEVAAVQKDSPADLAGIQPGDKIIKIGNKSVQNYTIQEINEIMQSEEGRWIYIDVQRKGRAIAFKFQLKKII